MPEHMAYLPGKNGAEIGMSSLEKSVAVCKEDYTHPMLTVYVAECLIDVCRHSFLLIR